MKKGILLLAVLCGACAPAQRRADAPAASAPSPYKRLTVAVLHSPDSRQALADALASDIPRDAADPRKLSKELTAPFQALFGRVARVERLSEAAAEGVDLVASAEVSVKKGWTTTVGAEIALMTPDGRPLDAFSVLGKQSQLSYVSLKIEPYLLDAARKAAEQIQKSLLSSAALQEFARAPRPARTAPAAAPSVPAEAVFSSDADAPVYSKSENSDNFAMVVGIEKYSSVPEARFAERDAAAVKRHLRALGYPERNILYLAGAQASRAGLAKNLESWLPRNVTEKSNVFFYYSGHGAPETKNGEAYLLPWDGDPQSLEFTAYPLKRLYEKLGALKARQVIVALDACFSGAGGRSVLAQGARPLVTEVETGGPAPGGKVAVLAAASASEITATDEEQGHGLFTYHLLKGLNAGRGDSDVLELYEYLRPKVQDGARRANRDQTPQLIPSDSGRARLR